MDNQEQREYAGERREIVMRNKRRKTILLLSAALAMELIIIAGIYVRDGMAEDKSDVAIRWLPKQTVLYTVHRGHYDSIGPAIDRLYNLAVKKGICFCGPLSTGYLNNPASVSSEHWLIEVRIPVNAEALSYAGTLGPMTDVKTLPAEKVAVAVKPRGYTNPVPVIQNLYSWINSKGYIVTGRMWQTVINSCGGDYSAMETEFMIPIDCQTKMIGPVLRSASVI